MTLAPEGPAIVYCQGAFLTPNGKTAHGLIRRSRRFDVCAVVDGDCAGRDAGEVLDGRECGVPIVGDLAEALNYPPADDPRPRFLIVGLAPDGGRLPEEARPDLLKALSSGLHVVAGLHDFLSEDEELARAALEGGATILDVRRGPPRSELHFFSGAVERVKSYKVAVLGTDSAVGKRTTAFMLTDALNEAGLRSEMIGTGQTAWLQGVRYGMLLDATVNDFVAGELEHAVVSAWEEVSPEVMVIEGQGSLMNPAFPGGFEILAATRPDGVVVQHAPGRSDYDGFPGYKVHRLEKQIQAIELISGRPVIAVTLNHEHLTESELFKAAQSIVDTTGLLVLDPLLEGIDRLTAQVRSLMESR